jgi:hydroxyethylthiazole kinase-like uncharacterized protein yjeF
MRVTFCFCGGGGFAMLRVVGVPVINVEQMREWEKATWATGQTEAEVIRRVGKRIARRARRLAGDGGFILILAGKGHNGDDARAAAEFLEDRRVKVLDLLLPESDLLKLEMTLREKPALVIDGIFGIGLNRGLSEAWRGIIEAVNVAKLPVLAVDVPSGMNADTGGHYGAVIEAAVTLTIGAPKSGMLAAVAWPNTGRLEVADGVGLIPCPLTGELNWVSAEDFHNYPPRRTVAGHKGSYGHVSIMAGSFGYHGAAVLATRGAQRAQPGLVTLSTQENIYKVVAAQLQAAMVNVRQPDAKIPEGIDALLVGPGMASPEMPEKLWQAVPNLWREAVCPLVVDASAMDHLPEGGFPAGRVRVLTPHPGEAARLLNLPAATLQADRVGSLRAISRKFGGCWVVLKGYLTLVGRAGGDIFVNSTGNPHLSQGGSGDLLAGFIAGLLAQPALQADVGKTLAYAVWEHGAAADRLQARRANWTVEDLAVEIGARG